jgi:hypothetical protein
MKLSEDFMKKISYTFLFILLLTIVSGCGKEGSITKPNVATPSMVSEATTSPAVTASTNPSTEEQFTKHKKHVAINPDILSVDSRSKLTPAGQEVVQLLDDYIFDFNNKIIEKDKFGAIDPPVEVHFGEGFITLKATDNFRISHDFPGSIRLFGLSVEVRKSKESPEIIWKGESSYFVFSQHKASSDQGNNVIQGVNDYWVLSYWGQ